MSTPETRAAAYAAGDDRYDARGKSTPGLSDAKLAADAAASSEDFARMCEQFADSVRANISETLGLVRRGRGRDVPCDDDYTRVGWADHAAAVQCHEDTARELVIAEHGRDHVLLADWPSTWREIARQAS